ncbi:4-alpha-glucanotransferase [Paratractidigestivibacter sp.]|uniref:4-alpha-glucanotransferase n=1 Tax=Paratractidigestivibacter sp. TaxID=2847316 RepID=UPI0040296D6C
MERTSGVLMPVSALPGPGGIGGFGQAAYRFVDFLHTCKQHYWQILPLTTTSYGDSPYQSFSARAGNPNLIDLASLVSDGLLTSAELDRADFGGDPARVDYGRIFGARRAILDTAARRFAAAPPDDYDKFLSANADWLDPYCEFMAAKEEFGLRPYWEWAPEARRPGAATKAIASAHPERIGYHRMTQYLFARQWSALKEYANARGVLIIGDMPIYVSRDSVEMWSEPELFKTAPDGSPASVAGTPPDNFSATGQYWGNPIYDWGAMAADGYSWWKGRMRAALTMYDLVRLDHFRGFEAYWEVPFGSPDSSYGSWTQGPGMAFFDELKRDLGELPLIAEDLGFLTPGVIAMRDGTGFPGMKILQFAFDGGGNSYYLPHNYTRNTIAYVGTHDNETAHGWFEDTATPRVREQALEYLRPAAGETIADALNRAIAASVSDTCIYTMQDLLGLGNEARTNTPATVGGNWAWRMREGDLTRAVERKLTSWTETYFRVPGKGDVVLPD